MRGGARVGAGRKAGTTDKALRKISADRVLNATGTGPDKTPMAYMLGVMNDDGQKASIRLQAAIAVAPYIHPKLSSVEVKGNNTSTLQVESDLGKALRDLAEIARLRGPVIDGELLEPATLKDEDIMTVGQNDQDQDTLSKEDKMTEEDGVLDLA